MAGRFTQTPFGAVSDYGIADFPCSGKSDPNFGVIGVLTGLNDDRALRPVTSVPHKQKLGPLFKSTEFYITGLSGVHKDG